MAEQEDKEAMTAKLRAGQLIVPRAQLVLSEKTQVEGPWAEEFDAAFGRPKAEALFVIGAIDSQSQSNVSEGNGAGEATEETHSADAPDSPETADVVVVRLGVMTQEAVANYLPDIAPRLTRPKTFFYGGDHEPLVTAIGWIDPRSTETDSQVNTGEVVFGSHGEFLRVRIDEAAPSIDEQVLSITGSADPAALKGLRLFHSFETLHSKQIRAWQEQGWVFLADAVPTDVFTERPMETWRGVMKRRPFPENLAATWTDAPEWN